MKKWLSLAAAGIAAVVFFGCSTPEDALRPAEISLAELEQRMHKATDPQGNFAKSRTYSMLQTISTPQFLDDPEEQLVEVKFERPNKFSLISYKDNKPVAMWCSNGERGWVIDYGKRDIRVLAGSELRRMRLMSQISNPQESFSKIFVKVDLHRCTNEDGEFYRIDCYGEEQTSPLSIYIDADSFLMRRMKFDLPVGSGRLEYDARIRQYELREGVMVPVTTDIVQNGEKQYSKITSYQLNPEFQELDFMPPVF